MRDRDDCPRRLDAAPYLRGGLTGEPVAGGHHQRHHLADMVDLAIGEDGFIVAEAGQDPNARDAVPYTHLTLPTKREV